MKSRRNGYFKYLNPGAELEISRSTLWYREHGLNGTAAFPNRLNLSVAPRVPYENPDSHIVRNAIVEADLMPNVECNESDRNLRNSPDDLGAGNDDDMEFVEFSMEESVNNHDVSDSEINDELLSENNNR